MGVSTRILWSNTRTKLKLPWTIWYQRMNYHLWQKILLATTPQTSRFYLLPKIQKPGTPGGPIVLACKCPTENIAAFLDEVMSPLVANLTTYVKDTNHTLEIVNSFDFNNLHRNQCFLFTMDLKSLYTVIPNDSGLEALAYFLNKRPVLEPTISTLTH